MTRILWILICLCLMACASPSVSPTVSPEEQAFQSAQALLDARNAVAAEKAFQDFQTRYPQSRYRMLSRLGYARSLEDQGQWAEAVDSYRMTQKLATQPEIAARAIYRLSYCYEALGDDDRAVASLLDSFGRRRLLPEEVALAEIPARLAMLYEKAGSQSEADKYVELAQRGISSLQGRPNLSKQILAKAYFEMGSVSLNQISSSNFSSVVRALKSVQKYSLRALAMDQSPWSEDALELVKKQYRDLWNTLLEMPGVSGVDDESIDRARRELQISLGGELLDLIQQAELYGPLDLEKKSNSWQRELYNYLGGIKMKTQDLIYRSEAQMNLTSESQSLNGLKRAGRIKSDVLLPQEKAVKKGSPVLGRDPNL